MKRAGSGIFFALILAAGAWAEPPSAQTVLTKAREAYTSFKTYELQAVSVNHVANEDFDQTIKSKLVIAYQQPDRFHLESKGMGAMEAISDGNKTWNYNAFLKQYTKAEGAQPLAKTLNSGLGATFSVDRPGSSVKSVKLTGEEALTIGGASRSCYLLEVTYSGRSTVPAKIEEGPTTYWIDKSTYLVLKTTKLQHMESWPGLNSSVDMLLTVTAESLKLDEPATPELFTFTPPPSAKLVTDFEFPGMRKPDLVGKPAADFKLRDLADNEVQLSSFKGKTVLLDFWATWCGPCREEIPFLETLYRDNPDLIILGVDVGEDASVVRKFVKENKITYPILLGGQDRMVNEYAAHSFPTVVIIDKTGVIRTYKTGYSPESEMQLRAALVDAGKPAVLDASRIGGILGAIPSAAPNPAVYRAGGGVSPPSVIQKTEPEYSEEARNAHLSGTVLLSVVVSPEGLPRDIRVVRPLGSGLDEKAVIAVSNWKFKPGMKDGKPVPVFASIEVNFRLLGKTKPLVLDAASGPRTAENAYREGMRLIRTKRLDDGLALLAQAIELKPDWAQAYGARARALYQAKRYAESIPDFDSALRLDPKIATWYNTRGLAYSYSGQHARAIEDYGRAIELAPNASAVPYNDRGWAYTELGRPEAAIPDLTKAIQMTPDYQKAYENRGKAYAQLKDWPHAIADFTAAIELNPTAWAYQSRADAKRATGDDAGAEEDRLKARQLPVIPPALQ